MKRKLLITLIIVGFMIQGIPATAKSINEDTILNKSYLLDEVQCNNYERQVIKVNGENMSYIQLGNINSKKSIVIIHGSSFNAYAMVPYGKLYASEGYNVVLVDLPGHYKNIGKAKKTFEELGDSVAGMINKLIKEKKLNNKSEIQGWSLGGSVALDIGIRYPKIVKSIGIIDSASNYNGIDLGFVTEETKISKMESVITSLKSDVVSQEVTDKLLDKLPYMIASVDAMNNDIKIDKVLNIDDDIGKIKVPVYDFYGSKDIITTIDKQKEMLSKIKKSKLYVVHGYNHLGVLENPKLVYNALKKLKK